MKLSKEIQELEHRYKTESKREHLLDQILLNLPYDHPKKIIYVIEATKRFPTSSLCQTPLVHFDVTLFKDEHAELESIWLNHFTEQAHEASIALGIANFYTQTDMKKATSILEGFLQHTPSSPEVWIDLGRYESTPSKRLRYFLKAKEKGSNHPNLKVWLARTAIESDDIELANEYAKELVQLAKKAENSDLNSLGWREKSELKSDMSHGKHWGHTVMGQIAIKSGNVKEAEEHLKLSAEVPSDCRLSSYGPSFSLAEQLANLGQWEPVKDYLKSCRSFWEDKRLDKWHDQLSNKELPDFLENP